MSWAQRGLVAGIVGLGALIAISRGGDKQAGLAPGSSVMKGAVYAQAIPVWKGAKFDDAMGGNYYDNIGGPVTFTSMSWFFEFEAPVSEVAAFYRSNLPAGAQPVETDDGDVAFQWTPPGAKAGEEVNVRIGEGRLQINEVIKAPGN